MIWCYQIGKDQDTNGEEDEIILLTIDTPMYVILDSGSTAHMVRDLRLLTNVKKMPKPITIGGVENNGEGIVCRSWGDLLSVKKVMHSEKSSANIL